MYREERSRFAVDCHQFVYKISPARQNHLKMDDEGADGKFISQFQIAELISEIFQICIQVM